jgi:hypothetical protein
MNVALDEYSIRKPTGRPPRDKSTFSPAQLKKIEAKARYDAERYRRQAKHFPSGSIDLNRKWAFLALKKRKQPGWSSFTRLFGQYVWNAKARAISFELTKDQTFCLMKLPCHYCGVEPYAIAGKMNWSQFIYNGLDRVDNTMGYTKENVVPCCEICNRAKKDLTLEQFNAWIGRLCLQYMEKRL